jgi:cytochrome c oxidase cbb3-type subunit 3
MEQSPPATKNDLFSETTWIESCTTSSARWLKEIDATRFKNASFNFRPTRLRERHMHRSSGIALAVFVGTLLLAADRQSAGAVGSDEQASVERGQKIFAATCSFCHGVKATGGEGGPDLLRSVLVIDDVHGEKIGVVVLNGRSDRGMPKFLMTPGQISDIATFLHHSIEAAADRNKYQIGNIVTGNREAGKAFFNGAGKCSTCHSVMGDLRGIGAKYDPAILQNMIVMPSRGRTRGNNVSGVRSGSARMVTVTLPSGQSFEGELEHIDDFNVALRDSNGEYHSFARMEDVPKVEVHDPLEAHFDMLAKYTDTEIHDLTAYLVTLK